MNIGTIARLAAIALGIMSALALARDGLGFKLFPFLDAIITAYGILLDALFLDFVLAIFEPVFDLLKRWFDWNWSLYPHWKHSFVLLWLFFAAEKRVYVPPSLILGKEGVWWAVDNAARWAWAALAALIGGTLAGTVALDRPAVLWWPVMAWFLNASGDKIIVANKINSHMERLAGAKGALALVLAVPFAALAVGWVETIALAGEPLFWWAVAAYFAYATGTAAIEWLANQWTDFGWTMLLLPMLAVSAALALGMVSGSSEWFGFRQSPSPGLAGLATFVAVLAACYAVKAVLNPWAWGGQVSYLDRLFANDFMRIALDVFAVLGGAAAIVYVGHLLA